MIRTMRAELVKYRRRRVLLGAAVTTLAFSVASAASVLAAARSDGGGRGPSGPGATIEELSTTGGGTAVFATALSFVGTFLFVVFVGVIAAEFSRGTMRAMLLRQPDRHRLLIGKVAAMLASAAVVLAATETLTWLAALVLAPGQGVATGDWASVASLGHALRDYGAAIAWVTGYLVLGTMLGVLIRSVPVALAVGVAWAGPFEHLLQEAWPTATRWFPGLLLEAAAVGGTSDVSGRRAWLSVTIYGVLAATVALTVFRHRDVVVS